MKKFLSIIVAVAILGSSVASAHTPFNGFGAGVSTGWTYNKERLSVDLNEVEIWSMTKSTNSVPLEIFVNYLYSQVDCFLWGLEVSLGYDFSSEIKFASDDEELKIQKGLTAMLTPKFGWNFQDCWAFYVLLGLGGTNFKLKDSDKSHSHFLFAIAPGLGAEVVVYDCFKVGFEYKYVHYSKRTTRFEFNNNKIDVHARPSAHDVRLRATFTF